MTEEKTYSPPSWVGPGKIRWVWGLWEPLIFYRRLGHESGTVEGGAHWAEDWYERMHSEETVKWLADLGINCLTTHYYKGFGLKGEAHEMERTKEFTELCHKHGIRVFAYHQLGTIIHETLLAEEPNARDWCQVDHEGKIKLYGKTVYWRWTGCQQNPAYWAYVKKVIRQAIEVAKVDGIQYDGFSYECHCDICQQKFREFLKERYPTPEASLARFGLRTLDHVRIPPDNIQAKIWDPIYQEVQRFRRQAMANALRELYVFSKELNPEVAVANNEGWPRQKMSNQNQVLNIPLTGQWQDVLVAESGDFPHVSEHEMTTKVLYYKIGNALGRTVEPTMWLNPATGGIAAPEHPAQERLAIAEAAAFGGHWAAATWALRPRNKGRNVAVNVTPELEDAVKSYFNFFKAHEFLFEGARPIANVALYFSYESHAFDFRETYPCVMGAKQILIQNQVPFGLVFSDHKEQLADYDVIILANQTCLSEKEAALFIDLARQGKGLLITGRTARCDENLRERNEDILAPIRDVPSVIWIEGTPERIPWEKDSIPQILPPKAGEFEDTLRMLMNSVGRKLPVQVSGATACVGVDVHRLASGALTVHLLNYRNEQPVQNVSLLLSPLFDGCAKAVRYDPDADGPAELKIVEGERERIVDLYSLQTYAVIHFT
ncbi:MAG: hypothetical protein AB1696_27890 [Planctomycetota bacterium]